MAEHLYILGVPNFANYEASTALLRVPLAGGAIDYVCIGEDRLTRQKHTYLFPLRGIDHCLRHFGLTSLEQVDYLATDYARVPRWLDSGPAYRKLEHDYLKLMLRFPRERIVIVDHHDAHAASCYYPSGFAEAGVLVVDGMGSALNTQTAYHFRGNEMSWMERGYDWGVGRLYSFVTGALLPYGPEKGYGKVMGLAAYGADAPPSGLDLAGRNQGMTSDYSHVYTRFPISRLTLADAPQCTDRARVMEHPFPRLAWEVQNECETQLLGFARYIHEVTGTRRLCIAGGVALNGRATYRILHETPIEEVWVQPACSDTGIAFGAALWAAFRELPEDHHSRCTVAMPHAYCGSPYTAQEIDGVLDRYGVAHTPTTPQEIARRLADGKVVALFTGGSEYGPRALGHRSILADPRSPAMKDLLNSTVKFREAYRPYAPVVLRERVAEYFALDAESPFMLLVADVLPEKRDVIPAVCHVDGTARVQTVTREANGDYYDVVAAFGELTGVPVLLNTSFNVNREPIVETPLDALICAFSTRIDDLVMEGRLVDCAAYRDQELIARLTRDREAAMESDYARLTREHLCAYDPEERDRYLREANLIADWHRSYRAKYELEQRIPRWLARRRKLLIVGSRAHTKCLYLYIPDFPTLEVLAFVPCDERPGERAAFAGVYPETTLVDAPWHAVDDVLISSHEYQRELLALVKEAVPFGVKIHTLYDDACDSLLFTLPGKWPVMNPAEAGAHGLAMAAGAERTASNIDFDFEPAQIDVGERYAVAVNYHFLRPAGGDGELRLRAHETPERFEAQLLALRERFAFCRCADLVDPAAALPESNVVVTFDDGAKDVALHAAPILARLGLPATVFVSSLPYLEGRLLDVQRIEYLLTRLGLTAFRKAFYDELARRFPAGCEQEPLGWAGGYAFYRYDGEEIRRFKLDLNYRLPYRCVTPVLETLFAATFGEGSERDAVAATYLSADELRRLRDAGWEVGIHTHHHRVLPRLDECDQRAELATNRDFLRQLTGEERFTAAYPFGFCDNRTRRAMKELGLLAGFTMGRRMITPQEIQARWSLPRYDVNDCFDKRDNALRYEVFASLSPGD